MPVTDLAPPAIIVTASRVSAEQPEAPASATVLDARRIERLGEPLIVSLMRLTPSAAVAVSGPAGSFTQLRIRGSEANHTLLFVDGIRANDPAAGNEPRFELLTADLVSRLEVVRGPQSALWGSEAIGGVVAVDGLAPAGTHARLTGEAGAHDFRRSAATAGVGNERAGVALGLAWQASEGIDSFDGSGDRDGYWNRAARLRAHWQAAPAVRLGAAGFALSGNSQFDGYDPATFLRGDTRDETRNRLAAGRLWTELGDLDRGRWAARIGGSLLGSSNRNRLDDQPINRTSGRRAELGAQLQHRFATGPASHLLILAADTEKERFRTSDIAFGGFSNQRRTRDHQALTAEWRADWGKPISTDIAIRRDRFERFVDATSLRAAALFHLTPRAELALSYGEGIAQPSFTELYGFFPGSFIGNPSLAPERSRGFEASLRFRRGPVSASLAAYRQKLSDEIVTLFDVTTFLSTSANAERKSKRQGIEASLDWSASPALRLGLVHALLDADEPVGPAGGGEVRETRRPRHSGSLVADGSLGRWSYGASIAYVGARSDRDFDRFPPATVRLSPYFLANARLAYRIAPGIEGFARIANAFDARYQDVVGYRTEGRSGYAGIRLAAGR